MRFNYKVLIIPAIVIALALSCCKTMQRENEDNPTYTQSHIPPKPVLKPDPAYDDYIAKLNEASRYVPIPPAPAKTSVFRKVFPKKPVVASNARRVKLKNVTLSVNNQTASNGSTIGANTQSGTDVSKTKESSVSAPKMDNTAGQGARQEVEQTSEAKSVLKKGIPLWWLLLGAAVLAVGYGGYQMFRRSVWPFRY